MSAEPKASAAAAELVEDTLRAGALTRLRITSQSMAPALLPGDWVDARTPLPVEPSPGDIVVLRLGNDLIIHRLISYSHIAGERRLVTQGDDAATSDGPWPAAQAIGTVLARDRMGRRCDFTTRRSRVLGLCLARISRARARSGAISSGVIRRPVQQMLGIAARAAGSLL